MEPLIRALARSCRRCIPVLAGLRTADAGPPEKGPVKVFILAGQSNMDGQAQVATATWILFCWAETAIISEPRQATGRTYWSPPPLSSTTLSLAAFSSSTE